MSAPAYDRIGLGYGAVRRPDPRLESTLWDALGDAEVVLNIGAGTGSYEPRNREVIAVEPSPVMIAQRPADRARAIRGVAESIPLADKSVDATMGVFTMQHWSDVDRGLREVLRVTRRRIVFFTLDLDVTAQMWLCRDYLPRSSSTTAGPSRRSRTSRPSFPIFRCSRFPCRSTAPTGSASPSGADRRRT